MKPSAFAQPPSMMTAAQRDRFLADGFTRLDNVIDADELQRLGGVYDRLFDVSQETGAARKGLGGADEQGRQLLPQVLQPHNTVPELRELRYWKQLEEIARFIFGADCELRGSHMILKPAGYGAPTPWHQDQAYHDPGYCYRNVNFWLPLDGATVESGCMQFVRGSHLGPVLPHTHLDPNDRQTAMVAQDQDYWAANSTAAPCPKGSCTLHHSYMLHYAGPNLTDQPRRAFIVVFGLPAEALDQPWVFPWKG